MNHTPGPWRLHNSMAASDWERAVNTKGYQLIYVDPVNAVEVRGTDAEANAHLIAAAPELLAVVKQVGKLFEELTCESRKTKARATNWEFVNDTMVAASKAIAKAKGN